MIKDIFKFNREIIGLEPRKSISLVEFSWLVGALKEEVQELEEGATTEDEVDALLDLCYFAIGGLARMGLTEEQAQKCFDAVHAANMTKSRDVKSTRPLGTHAGDAVKPEAFIDPKEVIRGILSDGQA